MKLPHAQLPKHLANTPLAPVYLVSGDELLLVEETLDTIRAAARKVGFSERIRVAADSNSDWAEAIYSHSHHLSLFSTKRIVELNLAHIKFNAAIGKLIEEYAAKPPKDTILLIQSNKLDSKTEKTKWYQALDKAAVIIPIWPITLDVLPQWIMQRASKANFTLTPQAANWLAVQLEGNLLAAAQEIEKLSLLQPGGTLDQETIEEAVTDHARFDIFNFVDTALSGNTPRSLRILDNLKAEDTEPVLILWALARELRTLSDIAKQIASGVSLSNLFSKYRIWEKRQPAVRAFFQRHKQKTCWAMLTEAAAIDRVIKGAEKGNVWDKLQDLTVKIAATAV